jgi:hypothetical protein
MYVRSANMYKWSREDSEEQATCDAGSDVDTPATTRVPDRRFEHSMREIVSTAFFPSSFSRSETLGS